MKTIQNSNSIREEMMRSLPNRIFQGFLTWLTGKPYLGQKPLIQRSNLSHLATALITLALGVFISAIANDENWTLSFVIVGWILTVSGARKLITTVNHYCVHGDLLPAQWRKKYAYLHPIIAEVNSIVLVLQNFSEYYSEHMAHHKIGVMATIVDPDMKFLWLLGFRPGMTKKQLWNRLGLTFISPKFHGIFIKAR
jgi:hypothetical protein